MSKINSAQLLNQLAKMKESEGKFREAEEAYERAENWLSVIKINLNNLDNYPKAENILRDKYPTETAA